MTNRAFIIDNPTVTLGPAASDVPAGTELTVTCDLTRAEITNDTSMVDTGTLCGPAQQPGKITFTLELEGYQSWETDAVARFLWDHMREQVPFTLVTKNEAVSATNPEFSGVCVCVPPEVGGTREEAAVFSTALPIVGIPALAETASLEAREALAPADEDASQMAGASA